MPEVKAGDVKNKPADVAGAQPGTSVAAPASTAVTDWKSEMAQHAAVVAQQERASSSSIGLRAGLLTYQGQPVKDNKLRVIIVDSCLERTLYEGSFDPNNIRSPVCFALSKSTQNASGQWGFHDVRPDDTSMKKQHETCDGCPNDKWGSQIKDGKPGRGKACQERRRLILIPAREAGQLEPEAILSAEVATMKTPVTSVRFWGQYVQNVAALMNRPPYGIITELSTTPDVKNQFNLTFKAIAPLGDDVMPAIMKKREMVQGVLMKGYDPQENAAPAQPEGPKKFDK